MSDKNPKLDLKTNIPVTVVIGKMFKAGDNEYGKWYGYNLKVDGVEHSYFATEKVHEQLQQFNLGTTVTLLKEEIKEEGKKLYTKITVRDALFDQRGNEPPHPPPNPLTDKEALESLRKERKNIAYTCFRDALEVIDLLNSDGRALKFTNEDARALAISFMISFDRKH